MTETPTTDEIEFTSNRVHIVTVDGVVHEIPHEIWPTATKEYTETKGMYDGHKVQKKLTPGSASSRPQPSDHEHDETRCTCDVCGKELVESDESLEEHVDAHLDEIHENVEKYSVKALEN